MIALNTKEVVTLAETHGLHIREDSIRFNESGLDFLVAFAKDDVGEDWVLRIPRRSEVMERNGFENKVLELVHKHVSFQVPVWSVYEDNLIAYRTLEGVPAGTIDHEIQNYVWEMDIENIPESHFQTLAGVLSELHNIPEEAVRGAGLPVYSAKEARESMRERIDKVKERFYVAEHLIERWQNWLNNDALWPEKTGLMHGDLHAGHTMIDEKADVTGLIDWTEAAFTDISNDFVFQYKAFGEEALDKVIDYYREAGGIYWPNMKAHIIELDSAYAVAVAEFAMASGLEEYEKMAEEILGRDQD